MRSDRAFTLIELLIVVVIVSFVAGVVIGGYLAQYWLEMVRTRAMGERIPDPDFTPLGLVGGLILAAILIFVVNRAWFGWTIQPSIPVATLALQLSWVLAAAFLACLHHPWRPVSHAAPSPSASTRPCGTSLAPHR